MLEEMLKNGYRMIGVFDGKKCIGISGFWIGTKLYSDKYLEPDNVVIDKNYRSKGIGKLLFDWLSAEAKLHGCKTIMLDAYLENIQGHKFYWREGFVARGFHFLKKL
jgi:GNAT superfamily N-acetyltransferase